MKNGVAEITTEDVLKDLDKIYGIGKCKDIVKNYAMYLSLDKEEKQKIGTYNVLIRNRTEYSSAKQLVDVIWALLIVNNIISTKYRYIERDELKKEDLREIEEELLIIDSRKIECSIMGNRNNIKEFMLKNHNKIFIIIDEDRIKGLINASFNDIITWTMEIEPISKENKKDYIKKFLEENKIRDRCKKYIYRLFSR